MNSRRAVPLHPCIDCAALPTWGEAYAAGSREWRPRIPRPAPHGGPRSLRCATHHRKHRNAARQRASDTRSRKRSGLGEELRAELLALQGGRCPCGRRPTRGNLDADHDHAAAAYHDHPDDVACADCMRGFLCRSCNRDIIGSLSQRRSPAAVAVVLRALADYLDDPPMAHVRRARTTKDA